MKFSAKAKASTFALLLAMSVTAGSTWAAPVDVSSSGVLLEGAAKQAYISNVITDLFRPKVMNPMVKPFEAPDGWTWTQYTANGTPMEHMQAAVKKSDRVVLQLHGGGYVLPLSDGHRILGVKQATLMDASDVYYVDYRLAPNYTYPAALDDAVNAYNDLLQKGVQAKHIILVGDSAGGNLALALSLYLKEHGLEQPGVMLLASPWATLEDLKDSSRETNASKDQVLGLGTPLYEPVKVAAYGQNLDRKDPRLSPMYADLSGLPPMLIQTGGNELFLTENQELADKAAADGVFVTLTVYPGMPHDFALLLPDMKDSVDSLIEMKEFVNRNMPPSK